MTEMRLAAVGQCDTLSVSVTVTVTLTVTVTVTAIACARTQYSIGVPWSVAQLNQSVSLSLSANAIDPVWHYPMPSPRLASDRFDSYLHFDMIYIQLVLHNYLSINARYAIISITIVDRNVIFHEWSYCACLVFISIRLVLRSFSQFFFVYSLLPLSASPWLVWYFSGTVRSTFGDFSIAPVRNQVINSPTTLAGSHLDLDLDSDLDAAALAGVALLPSKNRIDSTLTLTPISSSITYIRDQWTLSIGNRKRKRNWKSKSKIKIKNQKSKTKL